MAAAFLVFSGSGISAWANPVASPPSPIYEQRSESNREGIGKFYLGREIAHVMGHQGAGWLERPEREQEERTDLLMKALPIKEGDVVADIGAGSGYFTWKMAKQVGDRGKVLAVDIQPEMLEILLKNMRDRGVADRVESILSTVTDPMLPAHTVDLALMVDVYHELSHPYEMTVQMVKGLKPGGLLVCVEYRAEDPDIPIKRLHKMTEEQVKKEMSFQNLEFVETINVLPQQHILIFRKPKPKKPNIIFIMADDLGWADVGYNGAAFYETPNIDALRASGMEFSSAYPGASNCMPSRSCIISGMYVTRTQMWTPGTKAKGNPAYMKFLVPRNSDNKGDAVFPSKGELDPSVISVAEVLNSAGYTTARFGKWHLGPDTQGFHISDPNGLGGPEKSYYNDINVEETLTDAAVKFISENRKNPFFLYLTYWDVHTPIVARPDVISKYDRKFKSGRWDKPWNTTYAAMIEAVDTGVGRIRDAIQDQGLLENTLVVFTSDNGGHSGATWCEPLRGAKGAFFEGGIRVATCMSWPGVIEPGSVSDTPITGVDYLPTFAELGGAALPGNHQPVDGQSIVDLLEGKLSLENRSIFWHYPLYLSGAQYNQVVNVHGTNIPYWRASPCSVIRQGDWKLIQFFENDAIHLYNLKSDIGELENLAESNPQKAKELLTALGAWQKNTNAVIPTDLNPDFNPG